MSLIAALAASIAEAGTISGRVLNSSTGQYLKNAQVELVGSDRTTVTRDGGYFTFSDVAAGEAKVAVNYTGLDRLEQSVTVPETGTVNPELALTSKDYGSETIELAAFTVGAQREGNAKAIVEQKQALNIKTVIASDAFGDVTEGNVGEFLKLLPGISVDYVEADVRTVRVRGLSPKYANVTLDGNPLANAASSNIATGRQFEFEQVSLATLETVEVNKSPTADMPAAGLTGSINVKSKSAFSQKGRQIKYNANFNINEYTLDAGRTMGWDNREHYKWQPGGNVEFSDTFLGGRLGVVAGVSHSGSYVEQKIFIPTYQFDRNANNNQEELPVITSFNMQDGLKPTWRDSVVVNLDYKASDDLTLSLRSSYNTYDAPFHNRNWVMTANTSNVAYDTTTGNLTGTGAGLTNRTATSATSTSTSATATNSTATVQGSNLRKYGATFSISPSMNWKLGNLEFDGSLSYSNARNWYDSVAEGFLSQVQARMNGVSWNYSLPTETGIQIRQIATGSGATASNNASLLDLSNYNSGASVNAEERNSKDQVWTARGDLKIKFDHWSLPTTFKVGADSRLEVRDIENFNPSWALNANPAAGGINLGNYRDPYIPDFQKGESIVDVNGVVGPAPSPDKWKLYDLFRSYNTDPFLTTTTAQQPFNANVGNNLRNKLQSMWDIKEQIYSGYAMATVEVNKELQVLAGVRYEKTTTEGRAFDDIGGARAVTISGTTNTNAPGYIQARYGQRITKEKSYDNFFPSMQVRYEPSRDFVIRGAYFASILRPDFGNVAGGISVNDSIPPTFTVSNATLKPETAHNFDVRVEYYFEPVGVISLGAFRKEITDIQLQTTSPIDPSNIPEAIAQLGYDATAVNGAFIAQNVNGGDSSVWGLEADYSQQLSFLPGALRGLGVFANVTYIKPKDVRLFSLTAEDGIAEWASNAGVSWKWKRFSTQVKFNWRDQSIRAITGVTVSNTGVITPTLPNGGNGSNRVQYTAARKQVDLNMDYKLHRSATIFFNVSNVFDEESVQFVEQRAWIQRHGQFGARFTLGVKGSF
ncbi:TonB-dependent receptor [Nibricoccus aquaticus]|nr:TonB-dependent receptor [Nibricoccus aquaticus]